jgi:hydroxymethylbilane synthase
LAAAGLARLGYSDVPHVLLDPVAMPPAIGQGALAITARAGDAATAAAFAKIADPVTEIEVAAERAFLTALDGSCRTAIGALASLDAAGTLTFIGEALQADGQERWRCDGTLTHATKDTAKALGTELGHKVKEMAGNAFAGAHG